MTQVLNKIDDLYMGHFLNINETQGIDLSRDNIISSDFGLCFSTFKDIYSINWKQSFEQNKLCRWTISKSFDGNIEFISDSKKYRKLINFIYEKSGKNFSTDYYGILSNSLKNITNPVNEIEKFFSTHIHTQNEAENDIKHFKIIFGNKVKGKKYKESLRKVIFLIDKVKDSIFEFEKQNDFNLHDKNIFTIFSSIISSLNLLFFELAKNEIQWKNPSITIENGIVNIEVSWERVFIWSGFKFETSENKYDFNQEKPNNIEYLKKIFIEIGFDNYFQNGVFKPHNTHAGKNKWIMAVEKLHGGAEAGGFDDIAIMDSYMGGIIKELNLLGFTTWNSCDGHGKRKNKIRLYKQSQSYALDVCLRAISQGKYGFDEASIIIVNQSQKAVNKNHNLDRTFLLDVAELLHYNKSKIIQLLEYS